MPTSSPLRIIVVQGHRNTSGGNPAEAARTPAIANAAAAALRGAGHDVVSLQNDDGTGDDWFDGSLDAVARRIVALHRQHPLDVMLDIHLEGNAANTPGVFAIIPDGDGLKTLTRYSGGASNTRDRAMGATIAAQVARHTGLALRTRKVIAPGVMSERQTHVGADLGWRLAMFAYTAPVRDRLVRLVLECGNIVSDRHIIDRPDFARNVAAGIVAGIGGQPQSSTPDNPIEFGTIGSFPVPQVITVTAGTLKVRKWAETDQPIVAEWPTGTQFWARGWVIGEVVEGNPAWRITGDGRDDDRSWRVWSGGTDHAGLARSPTLG